ncbi:MAG: formylglycine-generating enzyme family protein [Kiritimatiellia bacterium]
MKQIKNRTAFVAVAVFVAVSTAYAVPLVSDVVMTQRAGTRIVDITYNLADEAAIVTLGIETNGVAISDSAVTRLSGDVSTLIQPGAGKSIVWNAGADWPENEVTNARARVTAWSVDAPPQYCAVDVVGGTAAATYPVYYYVSAEAVPGGVTNHIYKTVRILMRKLPPTGAEGFMMGSPSNETGRTPAREEWHNVVLTKAFYAGVYEVTQSQWEQVMGDLRSWPSKWNNNDYKLTRPVEQVSYEDIRGTAAQGGGGWPTNDSVYTSSFIGRLRSKAGFAGFDLPSDAQWEYACRADASGALNDDTVNLTNTVSDAQLGDLGRYAYNGGRINGTTDPGAGCTTENATASVGSYAPNGWGLYDMHGNVWEWCLDWFVEGLGTSSVSDPEGALTGTERVERGGCWQNTSVYCRSAYRSNRIPAGRSGIIGFRLVRNLPQ